MKKKKFLDAFLTLPKVESSNHEKSVLANSRTAGSTDVISSFLNLFGNWSGVMSDEEVGDDEEEEEEEEDEESIDDSTGGRGDVKKRVVNALSIENTVVAVSNDDSTASESIDDHSDLNESNTTSIAIDNSLRVNTNNGYTLSPNDSGNAGILADNTIMDRRKSFPFSFTSILSTTSTSPSKKVSDDKKMNITSRKSISTSTLLPNSSPNKFKLPNSNSPTLALNYAVASNFISTAAKMAQSPHISLGPNTSIQPKVEVSKVTKNVILRGKQYGDVLYVQHDRRLIFVTPCHSATRSKHILSM